jgi:mRNA interferase MazF
MPTFEQGGVVRVPFPYTDRNTRQHRPALVISDGPIGEDGALVWVAMITSAANRRWSGDWPINDLAQAGLPVASVVRCAKITTVEVRDTEVVGRLSPDELKAVMSLIRGFLAES